MSNKQPVKARRKTPFTQRINSTVIGPASFGNKIPKNQQLCDVEEIADNKAKPLTRLEAMIEMFATSNTHFEQLMNRLMKVADKLEINDDETTMNGGQLLKSTTDLLQDLGQQNNTFVCNLAAFARVVSRLEEIV